MIRVHGGYVQLCYVKVMRSVLLHETVETTTVLVYVTGEGCRQVYTYVR